MVKPAVKRKQVQHLVNSQMLSERRACGLIGVARSVVQYKSNRRSSDDRLRSRLKELAERYPRYGYLMLHAFLRAEGLVQNAKRTYRIYTEEGLQVRTKKRKKLPNIPRQPMALPSRQCERWSLDFVSDQLASGRRFRTLNIVDDFTRECVGQWVDTSISGHRLAVVLDHIGNQIGLPREIVLDNGPELTSKAMFLWSQKTGVKLNFIQPGKPIQNAFCESFNGTFRDNCLNQHWFTSLKEARLIIDEWRQHYNKERPHSSLGYIPPEAFAKQQNQLQAKRFQSAQENLRPLSAHLPVAEKGVA